MTNNPKTANPSAKKTKQKNVQSADQTSSSQTQNLNSYFNYSYDYNIKRITKQYLDSLSLDDDALNNIKPDEMTSELYIQTINMIRKRNRYVENNYGKGHNWKEPLNLENIQIADCIALKEEIVLISQSGNHHQSTNDLLAVYQTKGYNKGIYDSDPQIIDRLIQAYRPTCSDKDNKNIIKLLTMKVKRVQKTTDPDLIPLNNGIFNYKEQTLKPFSSDYYFLSKSHVDFVDNPENPILTNQDGSLWNVHDWFNSLSDDEGVPDLLWQVTGAVLRPNVHWNQAVFLYSSEGRNGKGTLCDLWRNLLGSGSYMTLPLNQMSNQFALEPIVNVNNIITDENDVGSYLDKAANLKALITGDPITIDRKFKQPITYEFTGLIIECLNDVPQIKDKSDSLYRRQLFIPMNKSFKNNENKDIKEKYLKEPSVLEYVLWYALTQLPMYYEFSQPPAVQQALEQYKQENDPVEQFLATILPACQWDGLPFNFLYALYQKWYQINIPGGHRLSNSTFKRALKDKFRNGQVLYHFRLPNNSRAQFKTGNKLNKPEPLIEQYKLVDWLNPRTTNEQERLRPANLADRYDGLVRDDSQNKVINLNS